MYFKETLERIVNKFPCPAGYEELTKENVKVNDKVYDRVHLNSYSYFICWEDDGRIKLISPLELEYYVDPVWFVKKIGD